MSDSDKVFAGSIPDIYDEYLVPMIFEPYAEDLVHRVIETAPTNVLETAAGSGVVTRVLAPLLSPEARYHVTDLNQPMLHRAARQQPAGSRIEWAQVDALALPYKDESFDVVCCQFGAMFFPDRVTGYKEAHRTLRDGGRFVFNVWDHIEVNEFADSVTQTATDIFPDDPPVFLARTPHGYHDRTTIEQDVTDAGFRNIEIHTISHQSPAPSPREPAIAYCQGTPLRNEILKRDKNALDDITNRAAADIERRFGAGPVSGLIRAHVIVATK